MSRLIWRLLRHNISPAQIAGFALANLVGLSIVITAIQFHRDISSIWRADDSLITSDYLVVSRRVSAMGSLFGSQASGFSQADIDSLSSQPWAKRIGAFTPSLFNVNAAVNLNGRGMSTYMFFEAIPDEFFDIKPYGWQFDPQRPEIPIVLSRDYLALYNFGFASTRGLPQISEEMIAMVPLQVSISGNGRELTLPARIAGFSSRLNTIAVPQGFIDWANANFANQPQADPSRLIVEVTDPGDPAIAAYLDSHGLESAGDKLNAGKAGHFLTIVTGVVITVGAVISLLALFILLLSIYLLIQKSSAKLRDLMLLGYTPAQVASHYHRIVIATNTAVMVLSVGVMLAAQHLWARPLEQMGATTASPIFAILVAIAITLIITIYSFLVIRRLVKSLFSKGLG